MSVTETVAEYICGLRFDALPPDVVRMAKDVILDQLACQLACSLLPHGRIAIDFARRQSGSPDASVIGANFKTSPEHAGLVNGILGHGDEIDGSLPGFGHASAVLLPTVLAVGEREGASGADLIVALVIGYDMASRMAKAGLSLDGLAPRNFHQAATAGSVAAAAAAGKMLSLGPTELQAAIGLGAEQACGLQAMQTEAEHMNKSFHMGIGSRNGIASAYLAELGYGGVMNVLDSPHSIFDAFVPGEGRPDEVAKALGERFDILDARFKRYASGSPTHTAIASLIGIMEKHDLQASDLSSILVKMPTLEQSLLSGRATLNINLEYIIAVAAMDRQVSWEQYSEERQRDPVLQELCRVVTTQGDPEMDAIKFAESLARPAEVTVRTRAGQSYTARMIFPPGSPRNPLGAEELVAKFTTWATRTISPEQAGELRTAVENLEDLADVNELGKLLRLDGGPQAATAAGSAAA